MKIGEKLRKIRDFYGYTQQHVADEIGISPQPVLQIRKGRNTGNAGNLRENLQYL
jgi:transcriptional regulator with XRE-family HTH domain